jgi:peptide/nickel transport system substrate-binding protein
VKDNSDGKVVVKTAPNARLMGLFFNTEEAPWDDPLMREAVHLAVDRQQLIELIQENEGFVTGGFGSGFDWVYPESHFLTLPGYRADKTADIARAKELVSQATGGKGLDVAIDVINVAYFPTIVEVLQQQLAGVDIRVTIDAGQSATQSSDYHLGKFAIAVHPNAVAFPDPDYMIQRFFLPTGERNWARWENAEFIAMYEQESKLDNQEARAPILRKMIDLVAEQRPVVGLTDFYRQTPMATYVEGFDTIPSSVNSDWRLDNVWLNK